MRGQRKTGRASSHLMSCIQSTSWCAACITKNHHGVMCLLDCFSYLLDSDDGDNKAYLFITAWPECWQLRLMNRETAKVLSSVHAACICDGTYCSYTVLVCMCWNCTAFSYIRMIVICMQMCSATVRRHGLFNN